MRDLDDPYRPPKSREASEGVPEPFPRERFLPSVVAAPVCSAFGAVGSTGPNIAILIGALVCLPCAIYAGMIMSRHRRARHENGLWAGLGTMAAVLLLASSVSMAHSEPASPPTDARGTAGK